MEYKIVKKAYVLDISKVNGKYVRIAKTYITYVKPDGRNKARYDILRYCSDLNLTLKKNGQKLTYSNIPIIRKFDSDIILHEGKEINRIYLNKTNIVDNNSSKTNILRTMHFTENGVVNCVDCRYYRKNQNKTHTNINCYECNGENFKRNFKLTMKKLLNIWIEYYTR